MMDSYSLISQLSLLEAVPYQYGYRYQIPDKPGVYLIHDLRGVLYAGRSISLRRRWQEHFWERDNRVLADALRKPIGQMVFSWMESAPNKLAELECSLIRLFSPHCNKILFTSSLT